MAKAKKKVAAKKRTSAAKKAARTAPKKGAKPTARAKAVVKMAKPSEKINISNFMSPLDDRLVVEPLPPVTQTAGGIFLPDSVEKSAQTEGLVLAVGPGHRDKKGRIRPMDVKVGDTVIYPRYAGSSLNIFGKDVQILRESEVLALLLDSKR